MTTLPNEENSFNRRKTDNVHILNEGDLASDFAKDLASTRGFLSKWKEKSVEEMREGARASFGTIIIWTFSIVVIAFAVTGCLIAGFGSEGRLSPLVEFIQSTSTILTPIVGFVIGHYFANKEK